MAGLETKNKVQKWLTYSLNDPITKTLVNFSHLTKTQLETFLIDVLSENLSGKSLKYDEKAKFRLLKSKISRGSFNRTLKQARNNVIKSIYTILLLGYIGVFDDTRLDPYLEVAGKLQGYVQAYKKLSERDVKKHQIMRILHKELVKSLDALSKPKAMSKS